MRYIRILRFVTLNFFLKKNNYVETERNSYQFYIITNKKIRVTFWCILLVLVLLEKIVKSISDTYDMIHAFLHKEHQAEIGKKLSKS